MQTGYYLFRFWNQFCNLAWENPVEIENGGQSSKYLETVVYLNVIILDGKTKNRHSIVEYNNIPTLCSW